MEPNMKSNNISILLFIITLFVQVARAQWVSVGPARGGFVYDICAFGSYVFICDYENGIFRSTDNGTSWETVNTGLTHKYIRCLAVKGNCIYAGGEKRYEDEAGGFFFLSSDSGKTWKNISSGFPTLQYATDIHSIEVCGNSIYAVTYNDNGVLRSTDDGTTWTRGDSGLVNPFDTLIYDGNRREITDIAASGDTVFAASGDDLFISYDSASSWTALSTEGLEGGDVTSLALPGNDLYVGTPHGYYKSTNGGADWPAGNFKLANMCIMYLASKGDTIFATDEPGGGMGPPHLYRSIDNGINWNSIKKFNGGISTLHVRGDDVFVGCADTLYRSTDNGITWSTIGAGIQVSCVAAIENTVLVQTYNDGIYRSTDNGNALQAYDNFPDTTIYSLAVNEEYVYAGAAERIFRSSDNGLNWEAVNSGNTKIWAYRLAVKGNVIVAGGNEGSVVISNDNGQSWTTVSISSNEIIHSIAITGEAVLVGMFSGVYQLTNDGTGWSIVKSRMFTDNQSQEVYSLTVNETDVFAGTRRGSVWRCPLSDLPLAVKTPEHHTATPNGFKMASPGTIGAPAQISFSLSHCQQVAIHVYNLSGAVVQSFPRNYFESGSHILKWDTRFLPPGCYWFKMQAGSEIHAKKVTLIR